MLATPNWKLTLLRALLLIMTGFWIYAPVMHGYWLWDDDQDITRNGWVHDSAGLWTIWFEPWKLLAYYPVTFSAYWVEWRLFGMDTIGYHVVSVTLHVLSGFLIWRLLARLGLKLAWLGGLIFVVHPAHVESVSWIVELKNTLSEPFFLLAMLAWMAFDAQGRGRDYALALFFYLAAILTKTTVVMFPFVLLLYAWWRRDRIELRDVLLSVPFFGISFVMGAATAWLQQHHTTITDVIPLGGFFSRLGCAGVALAFYFTRSFLPVGTLPIYPQWTVNPPSWWQFLPWAGFAVMAWACWRHRAGWGRHALLGLGFFVIMIFPFLGFKAISYMGFTWVMDHFLYLPMIGLIGLTVAALEASESQLLPGQQRLLMVGLATGIAMMALGSHLYASIFTSQKALWSYSVAQNPADWLSHNNLGDALYNEGDIDGALAHYLESIRINPHRMEAHYNTGFILSSRGQLEEGTAQYREALRINSGLILAHLQLANNLVKLGRKKEAVDEYCIVLAEEPHNTEAQENLAKLKAEAPLPQGLLHDK